METSERQIEAAGAVVQLERDEAIARIHAELSTPGAEDCVDCGRPIPAKRRAAISTDASDTASRVSASYMRQFIAGRRSWLDVMNALREAVTAQLSQVDSELSVMSAASRLMLRSGRWRPQFEDLSEDLRPNAGPDGK